MELTQKSLNDDDCRDALKTNHITAGESSVKCVDIMPIEENEPPRDTVDGCEKSHPGPALTSDKFVSVPKVAKIDLRNLQKPAVQLPPTDEAQSSAHVHSIMTAPPKTATKSGKRKRPNPKIQPKPTHAEEDALTFTEADAEKTLSPIIYMRTTHPRRELTDASILRELMLTPDPSRVSPAPACHPGPGEVYVYDWAALRGRGSRCRGYRHDGYPGWSRGNRTCFPLAQTEAANCEELTLRVIATVSSANAQSSSAAFPGRSSGSRSGVVAKSTHFRRVEIMTASEERRRYVVVQYFGCQPASITSEERVRPGATTTSKKPAAAFDEDVATQSAVQGRGRQSEDESQEVKDPPLDESPVESKYRVTSDSRQSTSGIPCPLDDSTVDCSATDGAEMSNCVSETHDTTAKGS